MSHSGSSGSITPRWLAWSGLILTFISFGIGVWGFVCEKHEPLGNAIFQAFQLFHLHFHAAHGESVPFSLEIARFGAATVGLGLLPSFLVLAFFRADLTRFWVRCIWRNHAIVCGHCPRTLTLVRDLISSKTTRKVVLIANAPIPASEIPGGVFFIQSHGHCGHALHAAAVHRARVVVALYSDDRANMEILVAAEKLCAHRRSSIPVACHVHLQDNHLKGGLDRYFDRTTSQSKKLRRHFFNSYEIVARNLACQFPLPETLLEVHGIPEHYVIVGFGPFGQNVALRLLKMGQKLTRVQNGLNTTWEVVKPRLTIVDPRGDAACAPFLRAHPAVETMCFWAQHACSCETSHFLDLNFLNSQPGPERISIIFAIDDEAVSLRTAMILQETCRTSEQHLSVSAIYVRIANPEWLGKIGTALTSPDHSPPLVFFAPDHQVFSADAMLRYGADVLARAVHEAYLSAAQADLRAENPTTAENCSWEDLSDADRESSRESADHLWAKLRTLGYKLTAVGSREAPPVIEQALLAEISAREDELARVEHYRWMTWRLLLGWSFGSPRDNHRKHHPDLIEYERLTTATQEKDKVIVRSIPKLLKLGGLKAERIQNIGRCN